jgi:Fe(3+) dicitrate transport protein
MRALLPFAIALSTSLAVIPSMAAAAPSPVEPAAANPELEIVTVLGHKDETATLPGSHQVIDQQALKEFRVMTTSEALRKAAGLNVRDEEGFGLRPNIGLRGLNPTRSTKMLLLEDGIPLAYAPYGDNASYYHPPIDRFARIEVLKGAAVNLYGPQTIGGVVNYITPTPPTEFEGLGSFTGGSREYTNAHLRAGARGLQLDVVDKRGDGARDNTTSKLQDFNLKYLAEIGEQHTLIVRANRYEEDSDVTYSGMTDAELANFGYRYNPFDNDAFKAERTGFSLSHNWTISDRVALTTHAYWSEFSRDWWRQASTTSDSQCNGVRYAVGGTALNFTQARAAGFAVDYDSYGIEPRLRVEHRLFGTDNELTLGARMHSENQHRKQINAASPTGMSGLIVEHNERGTDAWSAFLQNRITIGRLELTPGMRMENVRNDRSNRLNAAQGDVELTEWLPSLGFSYVLSDHVTVFGGVHKGFAPPRTEDLIDNSGVVTEVAPEESTNMELGVRAELGDRTSLDATLFRNDFDNQIAVGSIAGGSTPLAEGETLYEGLELTLHAGFEGLGGLPWTPFVQLAYTYLPTADLESAFVRVDNGAAIAGAVKGNRLPYAPEHLLTASLGAQLPHGVDMHLELVLVDDQYSDFADTGAAPLAGNGQIGRIDNYHIWNITANWQLPGRPITLFATVKNIADKDYIVDRTRGILTAPPRLLQAGVEFSF